MASDNDVVQNIVLAGQEEVIAGFAAIAAAGVAMAKAIDAATSSGSIENFGAAVGGVAAAITAVVGGLFAWTDATAKTVTQMQFLSTTMKTNLDNFSTFQLVLARSLGDTDGFTSAMKRLSVRVSQDWPLIQRAVRESSDQIVADNLRIESANTALEISSTRLAFAERTAAFVRIGNALSVRSAELALQEVTLKRAIGPGGKASREDLEYQRSIDLQREQLAVEEAELRLSEAKKKAAEDAANAEAVRQEAATNRELKELQLNEARLKQQQDQANNILNLKKYVEDTIAGIDTSALKVQVSSENIVRGIIAAVGPGAKALEGFKTTLGDIGSATPAEFDVLLKLADFFHHTTDETLKAGVAISFFGRGVQPSLIQSLSQGREAILAEQEALEKLGLGFTTIRQKGEESDEFISIQFSKSLARLGTDVNRIGQQFALLFAPGFTIVLNQVADYIEHNRQAILNWGASIRDIVIPALQSLVRVLTGVPDAAKDQWLIDYINKIKSFGNSVKSAVTEIIIPAFNLLIAVAQKVADVINKVFGTELTGTEVLIAAWGLRMLGVFGALEVGFVAAFKLLGTRMALGLVAGLLLIPIAYEIAKYLNEAIDKAEESVGGYFKRGRSAAERSNENQNRRYRGLAELPPEGQESPGFRSEAAEAERARREAAGGASSGVTGPLETTVEKVKEALGDLAKTTTDTTETAKKNVPTLDQLDGRFKTVPKTIDELIASFEKLKGAVDTVTPSYRGKATVIKNPFFVPEEAEGKQGGGVIPGHGTGDTVPIWATPGEFVITRSGSNLAHALRHFGQKAAHLIGGHGEHRRYSVGGLIGGEHLMPNLPRYADGGIVQAAGTTSALPHFGTIDLTTNYGTIRVHATSSVLDDLSRASAARQRTSMGPHASWVGR